MFSSRHLLNARWRHSLTQHFFTPRRNHSYGQIVVSEEVHDAIQNRHPVVALESTIVTHGMPFPENLRTAQEVEAQVRTNGAIPATVGIYKGKVHVGTRHALLESLARESADCTKVSRRDLPVVLAKGLNGGTTVSATMAICHKVGIPIFVTGGIGGVHRGGECTLDISADLTELGRTPITVVSAGIKSILDIGRTLEFLETQGVCVMTYGREREFPSFFTSRSGHQSPWNVKDPEEAASVIVNRDSLLLKSGVLIAVPIPEDSEADGRLVEAAINSALEEARAEGIAGNAVTPYILKRVNELTHGASLRANIALIKNNASVGATIAVALARSQGSGQEHQKGSAALLKTPSSCDGRGQPVVIGGSNVDIIAQVTEDSVKLDGSTHAGMVRRAFGGVGRNLADCMSRLLGSPGALLVSAVGKDALGADLLANNSHIDLRGVAQIPHCRTASYICMLDNGGNCKIGIGDMQIHKEITVQQVKRNEAHILCAPMIALDGNIPTETLDYVVNMCLDKKIPVWYEPTDIRQAVKPFLHSSDTWKGLSYITPNLQELRVIYRLVAAADDTNDDVASETIAEAVLIDEALRLSLPLMHHLLGVLVTMGQHGAVFITRKHLQSDEVEAFHYPITKGNGTMCSVSGAGDCLAAAVMCGLLVGLDKHRSMQVALKAASLSVKSHDTVPDTIQPSTLSMQTNECLVPTRLTIPTRVL
ncbi:uncharacterized protein LOC135394256 [Ornithodoros turicata]|uniref:uncharacterized protein LOC135394256 n=1 Tax=Ornithodoros turicata TaxID=34597 RepID=UPI0031397CA9